MKKQIKLLHGCLTTVHTAQTIWTDFLLSLPSTPRTTAFGLQSLLKFGQLLLVGPQKSVLRIFVNLGLIFYVLRSVGVPIEKRKWLPTMIYINFKIKKSRWERKLQLNLQKEKSCYTMSKRFFKDDVMLVVPEGSHCFIAVITRRSNVSHHYRLSITAKRI